MPLYFQTQRVSINQTANFQFPGVVLPGNYVVGSYMFSLYYPNLGTHNVRNLSISLSHGKSDLKTIYVTVNGNMNDDSGNIADPQSGCEVVVIAWVGSSDTPTLIMGNLAGVSAMSPQTLPLPANTVQVNTFLTGFNLALPGEQGVASWSATTSANVNSLENTISITGGSMLNGVAGTVDVGVVILTDANAPFQIVTNAQAPNSYPPIQFDPEVSSAVALISSFGLESEGKAICDLVAMSWIDSQDFLNLFPTKTILTQPDQYGLPNAGTWDVGIQVGENTTSSSLNAVVLGMNTGSFMHTWNRIHKRSRQYQ